VHRRNWELTSILTQKSGSAALLNLGYSYYANDQIQQITNNLDSLKTEKYTYDELRRLLTAQRGPDTNIQRKYSYDYDRFGNRWAQTLVAGSGFGGTNSFDYAGNRVTTTNFTYDNSGNLMANGPGTSFAFNPENFLTAAGASVRTSFIYGVKPFKNVTVGWVVTPLARGGVSQGGNGFASRAPPRLCALPFG